MAANSNDSIEEEFAALCATVWAEPKPEPKSDRKTRKPKKEIQMSQTMKPGVGLDIGTMNIVSARMAGGKVETKRIRDAFIDLEAEAKKTLRLSKVNYVEKDDNLIVLGDSAMTMANLFKREARRPLSRGVISAGEIEAQEILSLLIFNVLGEPVAAGEHCYYSVPAAPIDDPDQDVIYHTEVFRKIVSEHGYTPHPMNEAMAIIYSQCAAEQFSGLAASYGSGMCNVALAYQTVKGLDFSLARCLSADFPVLTETGVKAISDIQAGVDKVLDGHGQWVPVLKVINNGSRENLLQVQLEGLPAFPYKMTPDHRVLVKNRFGWEWVEARNLTVGTKVGIPVHKPDTNLGDGYYFGRKNDCNITTAKSRNLGRLLGVFLGDGSCGPYSDSPEFVQVAFNKDYPWLIEKYTNVFNDLFSRYADQVGGFGVSVVSRDDNVALLKLNSTVVARHLKERCYKDGVKVSPLSVSQMPDQMALGILEGLFDSDGWEESKRRSFGNTSLDLVVLVHHLLNRFGVKHSIKKRDARMGGVNSRGVQIAGRKPEYCVQLNGHVSTLLLNELLRTEGHQVWDQSPDFVEYEVKSIQEVPYQGDVYDLTVDSDHHSFSTLGMLVHNCGDWVDKNAAKAMGSTSARMCSIKEKGVNLAAPKGRDEEAIALYIRALIRYTLENIVVQFKNARTSIDLPEPIPFVVSGGTTRAGGFLDVFKEEFASMNKRGFPIPISEIRLATDPMTAVAEGLLVLATEE